MNKLKYKNKWKIIFISIKFLKVQFYIFSQGSPQNIKITLFSPFLLFISFIQMSKKNILISKDIL